MSVATYITFAIIMLVVAVAVLALGLDRKSKALVVGATVFGLLGLVAIYLS